MRMTILEVNNGRNVGDCDVVDLLGLDVDEDEASSGVVRVLDLRQAADDLRHDLVDFVV